jgi:hypothetical protein
VKKDHHDANAWNTNEFIHASLIMIQFHKLSIVVNALKLRLDETEKNDISDDDLNTNGKNIYLNKNIKIK